MSTLDDFFGDSKTAVKECLHCGGTHGHLIVAVSDAYGPTHWKHQECADKAEAARQAGVDDNNARWQAYELYNRDMN